MRRAQMRARLPDDLPEIEGDFAAAVIEGLSKGRKTLPCRYFYDARGSELFEEITRLEEYYPTRAEASILNTYASDIAEGIGDGELLVEFGSGSSLKTEILLDRITAKITYVPIDVSQTALTNAKRRLAKRFPCLKILPMLADFSHPLVLPKGLTGERKTGFFPGSTIGNLTPQQAVQLLAAFRTVLGNFGRLIIGIDLKKDPHTLVRAYNDEAGVTAAFNLNLLTRINRELHATFDERTFRHEAIYDPREGRIEMHLVSERAQDVEISGRNFHFQRGESIHTANSYKYSVPQFRELALASGWQPRRVWTDKGEQFSVHELVAWY
jgi:dimethylhistidine N-methyltransferase